MKPPYAIRSVPSLSGHAFAYRWRLLPSVCRHRASKPQGSSERVLLWQVTMDQLIFASLSHHHYLYEVGMLKVPAVVVGLSRPVMVVGLDRPLERPPAPTLAKLVNASSSLARASPNDVALAPGPHRALPWFTAHGPLEELLASSSAFFCLISAESFLAAAFASTIAVRVFACAANGGRRATAARQWIQSNYTTFSLNTPYQQTIEWLASRVFVSRAHKLRSIRRHSASTGFFTARATCHMSFLGQSKYARII